MMIGIQRKRRNSRLWFSSILCTGNRHSKFVEPLHRISDLKSMSTPQIGLFSYRADELVKQHVEILIFFRFVFRHNIERKLKIVCHQCHRSVFEFVFIHIGRISHDG
jgi:hypothetical protein